MEEPDSSEDEYSDATLNVSKIEFYDSGDGKERFEDGRENIFKDGVPICSSKSNVQNYSDECGRTCFLKRIFKCICYNPFSPFIIDSKFTKNGYDVLVHPTDTISNKEHCIYSAEENHFKGSENFKGQYYEDINFTVPKLQMEANIIEKTQVDMSVDRNEILFAESVTNENHLKEPMNSSPDSFKHKSKVDMHFERNVNETPNSEERKNEVKELEIEVEKLLASSIVDDSERQISLNIPKKDEPEEVQSFQSTNSSEEIELSFQEYHQEKTPQTDGIRDLLESCKNNSDLYKEIKLEPYVIEMRRFQQNESSSIDNIPKDSLSLQLNTPDQQSEPEKSDILICKEPSLLPVISIEFLPKLNEKQTNVIYDESEQNLSGSHLFLKKILPNRKHCNFLDNEEFYAFNTKRPKSKQQCQKGKIKSCSNEATPSISTGRGSKKSLRKLSKSFHKGQADQNKISVIHNSKSIFEVKDLKPKNNLIEKSTMKYKSVPLKFGKNEEIKARTSNKGINTSRLSRINSNWETMSVHPKVNTLCRMSLILEPIVKNGHSFTQQEIVTALKDSFWCTNFDKEQLLIKAALICMQGGFKGISVIDEKFKLYCSEEMSPCSKRNYHKHCAAGLYSHPLYIERILSKSQINRLSLESRISSEENVNSKSKIIEKEELDTDYDKLLQEMFLKYKQKRNEGQKVV